MAAGEQHRCVAWRRRNHVWRNISHRPDSAAFLDNRVCAIQEQRDHSGTETNVMPDFHLFFAWVFCVVPFFLIAVLPALFAASGKISGTPSNLRKVSLAFLGSASVWLALNKSQLLLDHHSLHPAKNVFLGFLPWPRLPQWLKVAPLLLLCVISFYFYKPTFGILAAR